MDLFATALQALGSAFDLIFHPMQLAYLVGGVVLGMAVGIFPGLGGIAGLSLVLPFIYGMDPVSGLAMMVGLIFLQYHLFNWKLKPFLQNQIFKIEFLDFLAAD